MKIKVLSLLLTLSIFTACANVGTYNQGVAEYRQGNYSQAAQHFQTACDDGIVQGCNNLAELYRTGQGVQKDIPKAQRLFTQSCNNGIAHGCAGLAVIYAEKDDAENAAKYLVKACKGGHQESCDLYKNATNAATKQ